MPELNELQQDLEIGDVASGDFTAFETNGFVRAEGSAQAFRDEYPSGPWVPAGGATAPDEVNVTVAGLATRVYCFDGNATEERISNNFEIPHDYAVGEPIEVHLHFFPSDNTAGTVKFFFDWAYMPVNGAPVAQTSLSFTHAIATNQQHYHFIKSFGDLPVNGYELGDKIIFNVRRNPGDAQDTYGADVCFSQCALHIPVDTMGSRQRYVK